MEGKGNVSMTELQNTKNITIPLSLIYRVLHINIQEHMHARMHPYISSHRDKLFLSLVLPSSLLHGRLFTDLCVQHIHTLFLGFPSTGCSICFPWTFRIVLSFVFRQMFGYLSANQDCSPFYSKQSGNYITCNHTALHTELFTRQFLQQRVCRLCKG